MGTQDLRQPYPYGSMRYRYESFALREVFELMRRPFSALREEDAFFSTSCAL